MFTVSMSFRRVVRSRSLLSRYWEQFGESEVSTKQWCRLVSVRLIIVEGDFTYLLERKNGGVGQR